VLGVTHLSCTLLHKVLQLCGDLGNMECHNAAGWAAAGAAAVLASCSECYIFIIVFFILRIHNRLPEGAVRVALLYSKNCMIGCYTPEFTLLQLFDGLGSITRYNTAWGTLLQCTPPCQLLNILQRPTDCVLVVLTATAVPRAGAAAAAAAEL
jgi:hypothetical protein